MYKVNENNIVQQLTGINYWVLMLMNMKWTNRKWVDKANWTGKSPWGSSLDKELQTTKESWVLRKRTPLDYHIPNRHPWNNIHTSNIIHAEKAIFMNICLYAYAYIHVKTTNESIIIK